MSFSFGSDNRLPQQRLAVVSYIIVGMIGVLLLGFWKLQVIDSDQYGQMAERNKVRSIPIIAPRGRMLDRDGRVQQEIRHFSKQSANLWRFFPWLRGNRGRRSLQEMSSTLRKRKPPSRLRHKESKETGS